MDTDNHDYAQRARAAFDRSGLTISALSEQTQMSRGAISAALKDAGHSRPGTRAALRAALAPWWDDEGPPPPPPGSRADDIDVVIRFIRYQLERMSDESAERAIQAIFRILAGTDA